MNAPRSTQRGAALVVGLMLLAVITLLAITGMNTASTELTMAGNEQFRSTAFQAAERGVEREIAVLKKRNPNDPAPAAPTVTELGNGSRFKTLVLYRGEGPVLNNSVEQYVGQHFEVQSTGEAPRNSTATHIQGAYYVARNAGGGRVDPLPGTPELK